ncbi:MAG: LPPG--FO 2-phospho-L-lactate transferase [Chloroflexota bacterium]|jgi:LPPG:FO 2-phospho-L-lactate transferase|nr:MAG: LPPG--FO 2-phospho-L-lactate transferase [Chloroflexota bacterium]|tara:strand:- start:23387 stop:24319 length:933 start_codon:yes stop_codon:yes gene_type:complete
MHKVIALAGGVGGAKLVFGLSKILKPQELSVVVNTADDDMFHGLHVSPDVDTVMYALAGLTNKTTGWGIEGDTFITLSALQRLGEDTWFQLGDLDLATHIKRTSMLNNGKSLTEATQNLSKSLGILHDVIPMSDDPVKTIAITETEELDFQDYFVRQKCEPVIKGVRFDGINTAKPSQQFIDNMSQSEAIIICPSNPVVSIPPIIELPGIKELISNHPGKTIGVSPIVSKQALKGPAAKMMRELQEDVSSIGVAKRYVGICDWFVIDKADSEEAGAIEKLGMNVHITSTIMNSSEDKISLANEVVNLIKN